MPRGDGTGPEGRGPRTGRGLGYCTGYDSPGFTRGTPLGRGYGYGRGFGRGQGYGRGYGRGRRFGIWYAPANIVRPTYNSPTNQLNKDEEIKMLKEEIENIEREKKELEKRLKELSSQ